MDDYRNDPTITSIVLQTGIDPFRAGIALTGSDMRMHNLSSQILNTCDIEIGNLLTLVNNTHRF